MYISLYTDYDELVIKLYERMYRRSYDNMTSRQRRRVAKRIQGVS